MEVWSTGANSLFNWYFQFVDIQKNFVTMATWHEDFSSLYKKDKTTLIPAFLLYLPDILKL